jgi:hypothetical protein
LPSLSPCRFPLWFSIFAGSERLARSQKTGRVRTCRIEPKTLKTAERWIAGRRTVWERRLDRLGEYLAEHPGE